MGGGMYTTGSYVHKVFQRQISSKLAEELVMHGIRQLKPPPVGLVRLSAFHCVHYYK